MPRSASGLARQAQLLHFLDYASGLHSAVVLPRELTSELLSELLASVWVRAYGKPSVLVVDAARVHTGGAFLTYLDGQGIELRQAAGEAHWQVGRVEANGRWLKHMFQRVLRTACPTNEHEWRLCVDSTTDAKNRRIRRRKRTQNKTRTRTRTTRRH